MSVSPAPASSRITAQRAGRAKPAPTASRRLRPSGMKRVKRKADSICDRAGKGGRGRGGRSTENPPGPRAGDGGWASLMIGAPWTRRLESQAEGRTVARRRQIGRESCRGRVGQYVEISGVAAALKKKRLNREK